MHTPSSNNSAHSGEATLLIVDDEQQIREPLCEHLQRNGFTTCGAANAQEAYAALAAQTFDLVVLDIMMPGTSGLDICRHLSENGGPPVILLTALSDDVDRIVGLEIGADDYLSKPFNPRELLARIRSVLRRTNSNNTPSNKTNRSQEHRFGVWQWVMNSGELRNTDNTVVMLSSGEAGLLKVLVEHPNQILSRDELINLTQGRDSFPYERSVDNMISRLRRKIEPNAAKPIYIQTVWGGGYKFVPQTIYACCIPVKVMRLLHKLMPQKFASQLLLAMAIVLVFAQLINLAILVDANRLQARENIVSEGVAKIIARIEAAQNRSEPSDRHERRGPSKGPSRPESDFIISQTNHASSMRSPNTLERYHSLLADQLQSRDIDYISFELVAGKREDLDPRRGSPAHGSVPIRDLSALCKGYIFDQRPPPRQGPGNHRRPPPPDRLRQPRDRADKNSLPEVLIISVQLCDNVWANLSSPHQSVEALTPKIALGTVFLLSLSLLAIWLLVRRVSSPLSELTVAAKRFGRGEPIGQLSESGPMDIQEAAKAFNQMQRRLNRTVETQRTMLRAVSHDLRTPLTSLRIRSEMIPEELGREKFIATIDEMTQMTEEILAWAKNISGHEEIASVDLVALIGSAAADFQDQGLDVSVADISPLVIRTRRVAIKRALVNLISNALNYAGSANISVEQTNSHILIHVDDNGSGIPEAELENVLKPFVRLESSRNRSTGGSGLGLSITSIILHNEGGKLILKNRSTGGLRATLSLPT